MICNEMHDILSVVHSYRPFLERVFASFVGRVDSIEVSKLVDTWSAQCRRSILLYPSFSFFLIKLTPSSLQGLYTGIRY